jgi:hypothetical protein
VGGVSDGAPGCSSEKAGSEALTSAAQIAEVFNARDSEVMRLKAKEKTSTLMIFLPYNSVY